MTALALRPARAQRGVARRVAAATLVLGLTVPIGLFDTARAATTVGALQFSPATGTDLSAVTVETTAPCPSKAKNILAKVYGPGFPADGKNVVGNTAISAFDRTSTGGLSVPLQNTLRFFANAQPKQFNLVGTYRIVVTCRLPFGAANFGDFAGTITFDSTSRYVAQEPAAAPSRSAGNTDSTSASPSPSGAPATKPSGGTSSVAASAAPVTTAPATTTAATHRASSGETSLVVGIAVAVGVLLAAWLVSTFRRSSAHSGRRRSS